MWDRITVLFNKKKYVYVILTGMLVILLIRNRFSFCWSDESLYVSNMYRLYQGDVFLRDEWNGSMLSSYVTLPLFYLFVFFKGSTEGVYLFFRDVCTFLAFFSAVTVCRILRKQFSDQTALACALGLMIYSRANICGCSYYNTGLFLFALADCLFYEVYFLRLEKGRYQDVISFLAGICLGMAILINPYLVVFLPVLAILCVSDRRKAALFTIGGCALCGMIFILYYLSCMGLDDFYILLKDGRRMQTPYIPEKLIYWFVCMRAFFDKTFAVWSVVLLLQLWLKRRKADRRFKAILLVAALGCFVVQLYDSSRLPGGAYIALSLFGIQILPVIAWEGVHAATVRKSIRYFYITGILVSAAFETASNNGIDAAGIGFVIASFGAVIALLEYAGIRGKWNDRAAAYFCVGSVLGITLFLRICGVYRDDVLCKLGSKITQGPAKGLYTTQEHLEQYNNVYQDVCEYIDPEGSVFIGRLAPWAYLCTSARCGVSTTWRLYVSDPDLEQYFKNHPVPEQILVLHAEYGGFQDNYISTWGENGDPEPNANDMGGFLGEYIHENQYQCIRVRSGILYQKPEQIPCSGINGCGKEAVSDKGIRQAGRAKDDKF